MPTVVTITGSPSHPSRSAALAQHVGHQLVARGFEHASINVRDLPATALLAGRADDEAIAAAIRQVERAEAIVVVTPIYKAAYSGVLKTFLDVLPQLALAGKVVLPLVTGGTHAHVLALDYALRPVLVALGAQHIVNGLFVLDKTLVMSERGLAIDSEVEQRLAVIIEDFATSVVRRASAPRAD
ncbi:MAG TPA: NADPH-dependent FMN reductase [Kofleriaceae bacterium]|nr:NADPH-dependent FMN reductase [Kofleriaceae bacterium]